MKQHLSTVRLSPLLPVTGQKLKITHAYSTTLLLDETTDELFNITAVNQSTRLELKANEYYYAWSPLASSMVLTSTGLSFIASSIAALPDTYKNKGNK
jgi:hypothetical protein